MKQCMKKRVTFGIILLFIVGSTVLWLFAMREREEETSAQNTSRNEKSKTVTKDSTPTAQGFEALQTVESNPIISKNARTAGEGMREFRNTNLNISLLYPSELTVSEYDEGNGARTFVFENRATEKSFEVFVLPYRAKFITADQFTLDQPSGVIIEPRTITIGGVPAVIFFGKNLKMGDTREVWFLYDGYLYEVMTYAADDAWLSQIMATWQFTE